MAKTLVGFDLETNGIDTKTAEILQIGAITADPVEWDLNILFNQKSYPTSGKIEQSASDVHGIYLADLKFQPSDHISCATFVATLVSMQEAGLDLMLVTYNGETYDIPIIKRYGFGLVIPHIDVYRIVQRTPELFKHGLKLRDVHEGVFQKPLDGAHDAVPDVTATLRLMKHCMELLSMTAEEIFMWLAKPQVLEICYFGKHAGKPFGAIPRGYLRWVKDNWTDLSPDMAATLEKHI